MLEGGGVKVKIIYLFSHRNLKLLLSCPSMCRHSQLCAPSSNIVDNATYCMIDYLVADKQNIFIAGPPSLHVTLNYHKV